MNVQLKCPKCGESLVVIKNELMDKETGTREITYACPNCGFVRSLLE